MDKNIMTNQERSMVEKHPIIIFFILAYLLFFLSLLIIGMIIEIIKISNSTMQIFVAIAAWTPNIAAIFIIYKINGKNGIRELLSGWKKWRVSILWYFVAIIPIIIAIIAVGLNVIVSTKEIQTITDLNWITIISMFIFNFIQGATGEELGWRGFALPRLEKRYSPLISAILLGVLISGWHSILHMASPIGIPEWQFWIIMVCYSIIITWIYEKTNRSLVIVTLCHFCFNLSLELVVTRLGLITINEIFPIYIGIYLFLAISVTIIGGKQFVGLRKK